MDQEFLDNYWKYYLILEEDFLNTIRYVQLHEDNFKTFSVEYTKQYQAICSEIDVVCKQFCKVINSNSTVSNIIEYAETILTSKPGMSEERVTIKKYKLDDLYPWKEWKLKNNDNKHKSPTWWRNYNNVKHNRLNNFQNANLGNVLNALAGLYVLEVYCYEKIKNGQGIVYPTPRSKLFTLNDFYDGTINKRKLYELGNIE